MARALCLHVSGRIVPGFGSSVIRRWPLSSPSWCPSRRPFHGPLGQVAQALLGKHPVHLRFSGPQSHHRRRPPSLCHGVTMLPSHRRRESGLWLLLRAVVGITSETLTSCVCVSLSSCDCDCSCPPCSSLGSHTSILPPVSLGSQRRLLLPLSCLFLSSIFFSPTPFAHFYEQVLR